MSLLEKSLFITITKRIEQTNPYNPVDNWVIFSLYITKFEPKAVKRDVKPQTASAKIGLRHREMTQML